MVRHAQRNSINAASNPGYVVSVNLLIIFLRLSFHQHISLNNNIVHNSQNLPFKRIKHIITEQDFQPTVDSCILIMVFGQLQVFYDSSHFILCFLFIWLTDELTPCQGICSKITSPTTVLVRIYSNVHKMFSLMGLFTQFVLSQKR